MTSRHSSYLSGRKVLAAGLLVMGLAVMLFQPPQWLPQALAACSGQNLFVGSYYLMPDDGSHPDFEQPLQPPQDVQGQLQPTLVNGLPVPTAPNPPVGSPVSIRQFDWYTPQYQIFSRLDNNPLTFSNDRTPNTTPYFGPGTQPAASQSLPANKDLFTAHWHANLVAPPVGLTIPYSFALDDAGWVYLDGQLKIDHGGIHPPATFLGNFTIPAGTHAIDIFYADRHTVDAVTNFQLSNLGGLLDCGSPNLNLTKSVQPTGLVNPGDVLTYTVRVVNSGNFTATNTIIRDTTPANTGFVSASPVPISSPAVGGAGEVVWNIGTLPAGGQQTITFVVRVNPNTPPAIAISNAALATSDESGGIVFKSNGVTNNVAATANLALGKTAVPPGSTPLTIGDNVTYSLVVSNTGNVATGSVVVSDPLPPGSVFVGANPAPQSVQNDTVRWVLPPLDPNSSRTLSLTVQVINRPAGGLLQNQASAASNGLVAGSPLVTHTVQNAADLSLLKLVDNTPVVAGAVLTYHLQTANAGPSTATGVVVTDTLPAQFTLLSSTPPVTSQAGNVLTWNLGNLNPGESPTITFSVRITDTYVASTPITNVAGIKSGVPDLKPTNNTAIAVVPGNAAPNDVQVVKDGPAKVGPNQSFVYTLKVTSVLGGDNIVVTDTLPAGLTLVPEGTSPPALGSDPTYHWVIGHLDPNGQTVIRLAVRPTGPLTPGTNLDNTAQVQSGTGPTRTQNNSNKKTVQVVEASNLSISKATTNDTFKPGQPVNFVIAVKNNAATASGVVTITDNLLPGLLPQSATPPWTSVTVNPDNSRLVTWVLPSVPGSATANLNLNVLVPSDYTGLTISNSASMNTDTPNSDPNLTSNPVKIPRFDLQANLVLNKDSTAASLKRGQVYAYTIKVVNSGPIAAQGVTVQDPLPPGLSFVSAQPAPTGQNPLTWNVGNLPANGGQAQITLLVQLDQNYTGASVSNRASVSSLTGNSNGANNFSLKTIPIAAPPASATPAVTAVAGNTPRPTTFGATATASVSETALATTSVATTGGVTPGDVTATAAATPTSTSTTPTPSPTMPNAGHAAVAEVGVNLGLVARLILALLLVGGGVWVWRGAAKNRSR